MEEGNGMEEVEEVSIGAVFKADPDVRGSEAEEENSDNYGFPFENEHPVTREGGDTSNLEGGGERNGEERWTVENQLAWRDMTEEKFIKFQEELETERRGRKEWKEKVEKLVDFITITHGEFGHLLQYLVSLTSKNPEVTNILNVGPFGDEKEMDSFVNLITSVGDECVDQFENLGYIRNLLERANAILKLATPAPASATASEEDGDNDSNGCIDYEIYSRSYTSTHNLDPGPSGMQVPSSSSSKAGKGKKLGTRKAKKSTMTIAKAGYQGDGRTKVSNKSRTHGPDRTKFWGHYCLCGLKSRTANGLRVHIKYYTTVWRFQCEMCSQRFLFASILKKHYISKHHFVDLALGEFSCSTCGQEFEDRGTCFKHVLTAHGRKSFGLDRERKRGTGILGSGRLGKGHGHGVDKQSTLPRCLCGNRYMSKDGLMVHIRRSKENRKLFKCSICRKRFFVHQQLKNHVLGVHKTEYQQGKYGCRICGATFGTVHLLRTHRIAVHENNTNGSEERETSTAGQMTFANPGNDDVEDIDTTKVDSSTEAADITPEVDRAELVDTISEPSSGAVAEHYASSIIYPHTHPQPFTPSSISSDNGDADNEIICID